MRYVNGQLVLRLTSALEPQMLGRLSEQFCDILSPGGGMAISGPLPAEADDPDLAHLPRLVVDFNRRDFGRLRGLIDRINEF